MTDIRADQPIMAKWRCWDGGHYAAQKLVLNPAGYGALLFTTQSSLYAGKSPESTLWGRTEVKGQRSDEILQNTTRGSWHTIDVTMIPFNFLKTDSFEGVASEVPGLDRSNAFYWTDTSGAAKWV